MNTLTKLAMGLMGHLAPRPLTGTPDRVVTLPTASIDGGMPLMQALAQRQSQRQFKPGRLEPQTLGDLLWAAAGINRSKLGGRTAPSAMNAQESRGCIGCACSLRRMCGASPATRTLLTMPTSI